LKAEYPMDIWENELAAEINSGGFQLSIVAASAGVGSVKYIIRIEKPNWDRVDYVGSLEGFKKLGELLLDLNSFVKEKIDITDKRKLNELLTAENIKEYAKLKKNIRLV
jgi:predicted transcriptional regulator